MESDDNKIFVGNIPRHINTRTLHAYFESFGKVTDISIPRKHNTKALSFGFVNFAEASTVSKLLSSPHTLDGQPLIINAVNTETTTIGLLKQAEGNPEVLYLFIPDVPKNINVRRFLEYFSQFGRLKVARLSHCHGRAKDRAYIQFEDLTSTATVKCKKHRIDGLCEENNTLVCKVGMFKTPKQLQIINDAEDLLPYYLKKVQKFRKQDCLRSTETLENGLQVEGPLSYPRNLNSFTIPIIKSSHSLYNEASRAPETMAEILGYIHPKRDSLQDMAQLGLCCTKRFCNLAALDQSTSNYRFNLGTQGGLARAVPSNNR